ncbi:hypothetical protein BGZ58_010207 [Dissophora ornata]|nr:hypothetical protein BGZ58_010207 [Dissophora ornata]
MAGHMQLQQGFTLQIAKDIINLRDGLEYVQLSGCSRFVSVTNVLSILDTPIPCLKTLDLHSIKYPARRYDIQLPLNKILDSPWGCIGLQVLRITISERGEERPDIASRQRLCRQIGLLTHLQELSIRDEFKKRGGFAPILGQGLEFMDGLKKLEILRISPDAQASYAETKWIKSHWPSLRVISGLRLP